MTMPATVAPAALPGLDLVGQVDTWALATGSASLSVHARFLGYSTSHRADHNPRHAGQPYAPTRRRGERGQMRCSACRWFESRIFREVDGQRRYLIHLAGMSVVPGEATRASHEWVRSGYEVVEALITRRREPRQPARCPVCDGTGLVSRPPGTAGDQRGYGGAPTTRTYGCQSCDGHGVLFSEESFLTQPAARVLAQAAGFDHEIHDAYVNRTVS